VIELRASGKIVSASYNARIESCRWQGLRLKVKCQTQGDGLHIDLRSRPADAGSSLCSGGKELGPSGEVALLIADDSLQGSSASLVICDPSGQIIARKPLTIGED
jgi:hypothetical protein